MPLPTRRDSYLASDVLQDIAGRMRFGASEIESRLKQHNKPEPKPWAYPTHQLDEEAAEFGMKGFEFKVLQDAAMRRMKDHAVLRHYYTRFLMAAKLVLDDELEKARQYERRISQERNARDQKYVSALRAWEQRNKQLTNGWQKCRDTIRTRWNRMGKSVAAMLEKDASLASMDLRDVEFLRLLSNHEILKIDENAGRVSSVDWNAYVDMSIEDMNQVIQDLNSSDQGGFIKEKNPND